MTCIIGVEHPNGKIGIAADGQREASQSIVSNRGQKLIRFESGIVATSGPCRLSHLVRMALESKKHPQSPAEMTELLARIPRDDGWEAMERRAGESPAWCWSAVLAWSTPIYRGVYFIGGDGSVTHVEPGFPATTGSGSPEAAGCFLGRTLDVDDDGWDLETELRIAVETAARLDTGSGGVVRVEVV